jgi:hypothetical protein
LHEPTPTRALETACDAHHGKGPTGNPSLRYRWNGNHAAREWEIAMNVLKRTNAETEQLSDAELDQVSGGFSIQEMMSGLKLMGEMLSNVSKTRSEISMTFARNARA